MGNIPLKPEEIYFAANHHRLIYKYLKQCRYSKEDYYDIAVFGYLKAVRDYCNKEELRKYAFSTICWKYMSREVSNYHAGLQRKKRVANMVCIYSGHELPIECNLPYGQNEMVKMESRLLLYELAKHIPESRMQIVRLYYAGHTLREIARLQGIKIKQVREALHSASCALKQLCYLNDKEESTNGSGEKNRKTGRQPCTSLTDRAQGNHRP